MAATPLLYNQLEYKMAAVMQGKPYRVVKTAKGLDVPYGSEYVLEGRLLARQREVEGPFGEFPGYYSGEKAALAKDTNLGIGTLIALLLGVAVVPRQHPVLDHQEH